ncbi:hypothetical protein [Mesorhizobium sp.]|uniref:hypothetical protein n=1 Tax=Mesorhizobium sp. TaxID=1871066 RepID=UPI000FE59972|nr:hypothetical protein [Mesorhizobium sp.]RWE02337.1 MAG: hypothetical protein EOS40_08210 [Mesorhizobium sp.]
MLTLEIATAAALISCLLGIACIFLTRVTWSNGRLELVQQPTSRRILLGTLCGGMLTGLVTAPVLMAYFGSMNRPEVTPEYLLPGSIIGASIIIFSIVNFRVRAALCVGHRAVCNTPLGTAVRRPGCDRSAAPRLMDFPWD